MPIKLEVGDIFLAKSDPINSPRKWKVFAVNQYGVHVNQMCIDNNSYLSVGISKFFSFEYLEKEKTFTKIKMSENRYKEIIPREKTWTEKFENISNFKEVLLIIVIFSICFMIISLIVPCGDIKFYVAATIGYIIAMLQYRKRK